MQVHHVIYFDTATEQWYADPSTDAYMPDGEVWEPGDEEWRPLSDMELRAYIQQADNMVKYLNENPYLLPKE
jgi:hypothetical protein